jgi:hypothetical protein
MWSPLNRSDFQAMINQAEQSNPDLASLLAGQAAKITSNTYQLYSVYTGTGGVTVMDITSVPDTASTSALDAQAKIVASELHFVDAKEKQISLAGGRWIELTGDLPVAASDTNQPYIQYYGSHKGLGIVVTFSGAALETAPPPNVAIMKTFKWTPQGSKRSS